MKPSPLPDADGRSSLVVRCTLWVASVLLRRRRSQIEPGTRREILDVLALRLADARASHSLPAFLVRAVRECAALTGAFGPSREEGLGGWRGWADDAALALKSLTRRPAFAFTAVLILALGIGAGATAFSVLDSVLYRLPHYDKDRSLAVVWKEMHGGTFRISGHGLEEIELYRSAESFAEVTAYRSDTVAVFDGDRAERLSARWIDLAFLPMVRAEPRLGRAFAEDDIGTNVVLISETMWTERFGRDPEVLGRLIEVEGEPRQIVGVLPRSAAVRSFSSSSVDLWMPLDERGEFQRHSLDTIVRLAPDVEQTSAEAELASLSAPEAEQAGSGPPIKTLVRRLHEDRVPPDTANKLWMIFGGVGLLLLAACANASSLALTRDAGRRHEVQTRLALGASRGRLVRERAVESLMLGGVAGSLGGLITWQAVPLLMRFAPDQVRSLVEAGAPGTGRTLLFLLTVSLLAALLVAFLPVLRLRTGDGTRRRAAGSDSRSTQRWGTALVTAQVAIAFVLLTASGLLLRSFDRMMRVDPGYALDRLHVMVQAPPGFDSADQLDSFYGRVKEAISSLPGTESASWGDLPTRPALFGGLAFEVDGEPLELEQSRGILPMLSGDDDYFAALGIDLVVGRSFQADDPDDALILGRSLAEALVGDADAVGRRVRLTEDGEPHTIVGVAEDVRTAGPEETLGPFEVYRRGTGVGRGSRTLVVAFERDPLDRLADVRAAVARIDVRAPVDRAGTLGESWHQSMERPRFLVEMAVALAAVTLALTLFGLYSVLSYAVAQRRREIGVRMALGANASRVRWLVIRQSALAVGLGLGIGGLGSWALRRALEAQLFEITTHDGLGTGGALVCLLVAAMLASWVPAARATRIEPSRTLRDDA